MQHFTFGRRNGFRVSEISLGTTQFGSRWGYGATPEEMPLIFKAFADAGGTFIDTAPSYQDGESEENIGALIAGCRADFSVATKFSIGGPQGFGPLHSGGSRGSLMRSVEGSLRRLGTDYVDMLWVHWPDTVTPIDETLRAIDDLARAGKVLYAGLSNHPAWLTAAAVTTAELRGLLPVAGAQFEYSLVERTADREIFPMVEAFGIGAALWSPLGGGVLTGKYRLGETGRLTERGRMVRAENSPQRTAVVDFLMAAADGFGVAPDQIAFAWLLERARRSPTGVVPIVGPRTHAQMKSYLTAVDLVIGDDVYQRLDEISAVDLGEPHESLRTEGDKALGGDRKTMQFHPIPTV
jgi:aryl-alcohol dehydrogenase-like predicted oxidoreductase